MKPQSRLRLHRPTAPEPSMPYVNGKRFYCRCGVGVFTRQTIGGQEIFTCNGCTTAYAGTLKRN